MVSARERGNSRCGKFSIELRNREEQSSTYMFSVEGKPLAQAKIPNDSISKLKRLPEELSDFDQENHEDSQVNSRGERQISGLKFGTRGVSFKAQVVKKSEVRAVTSKDGNPLLVCSVTLSDGTGEIPLAVWNNQIPTISEGDLVEVQDARVGSFRGEKQLSLNRKTGALRVLQSAAKSSAPKLST
jgi:ssDNA-binding replication factor A large subunit